MEAQKQYGVAQTVYFTCYKAGTADFAATADWTPATGDTKISKDGGNVANTSNNPAAVGGTGSVWWSLALTATEWQAGQILIQIVDSATKAIDDVSLAYSTNLGGQIAAAQGVIVGEVDTATFTATTTQLEGFRISPNTTEETTASHYVGRLILFTSGVAQGSLSNITAYSLANSKEKFTYDAVVTAPGDGDSYVIL
jgi:hypothetical protein